MLIRFFVILLFVMTTSPLVFGQHVPYGLREKKVQDELLSKTGEFDSLVLFDKASYWDEDMKIFGIGFRLNKLYSLTLEYKDADESFYDMSIKSIKSKKISSSQTLKDLNLNCLRLLNNDSLNARLIEVSDCQEWTIVVIKNKEITLKQSYDPEDSQRFKPTRDRKHFIHLFNQLVELSK